MKYQQCNTCHTKLKQGADYCHACGAKVRKRTTASTKSKRQIRIDRNRRRDTTRYVGATILVGSLLLLVALVFRPNASQPDSAAINVPDAHDGQGIPYPEVPRILLSEAKDKFDSGSAIFVDVRDTDEYEMEHISNAISMPPAVLETRYRDLPKDAEILTYCT